MGNSITALVLGIEDVELKFTSGRILTLTNVFYVSEVRNKFGFR